MISISSSPELKTTTEERYFIPTKFHEFRTFICNTRPDRSGMMLKKPSTQLSESKRDVGFVSAFTIEEPKKFYPYGYIAYLLRVNGYNISSLIPIVKKNTRPTINLHKLEYTFKQNQLDYKLLLNNPMMLNDETYIYPVSTVYFKNDDKHIILYDNRIINQIMNFPTRYVFINVLETIILDSGYNERNMLIFIDKVSKTIEVLLDENFYNDSENSKKSGVRIRHELIQKINPFTSEYKINNHNFQDKLTLEEKQNSSIIIYEDINLWHFVLLHHKILNPNLSFEQINTEITTLITKDVVFRDEKLFVYSYYKKIISLSQSIEGDLTLLNVYF
jgi:hypothetical protein